MSFLIFRAFETKVGPVLISPTTTNQDQVSNEVLRHAKKHHIYKLLQRNFSPSGFPAPFSFLPSSLPWERALESFSVVQQLHLFTQFLWSHQVAAVNKKSLFLPVTMQNRRQLLFSANPRGAGEFLWILWFAWNALDSHPVFPTISNHPLCLSPQSCQFSWHCRD